MNILQRDDATAADDADDAAWSEPVDDHLSVAVVPSATPGDWTIVSVSGEVDMASAATLADALGSVSGPGAQVILDLSGVSFMDSTGLSVLIRAYRSMRDDAGELRIVVAGTRIPRLLEVTRLDRVFPTFATVAVAQERPAAPAN